MDGKKIKDRRERLSGDYEKLIKSINRSRLTADEIQLENTEDEGDLARISHDKELLYNIHEGGFARLRSYPQPRLHHAAELLFTEAMVELMQAQVSTIDPVLEYGRVMPSAMWSGVRNSHIPLEALWKYRSNQIPISRDELKHLYDCGECVGSLCICKISKTIEAAKGLKQGKPKLHNFSDSLL